MFGKMKEDLQQEFKNIREACKACIKVTRTIKPDAKAKRLYRKLHAQYVRLYPSLKDEFARIAELTG